MLQEMAHRYKELRSLRAKLEEKAKELKAQEQALQGDILQHMLEKNIQSVHYPGVGRLVRVTKSHYEITDKEAFAAAMLSSLSQAKAQGRPLAECALAQMRVSRESLEAFLEAFPAYKEQCGAIQVEKPELSLRKN